MIDNYAALLALRGRLRDLLVSSTGVTTLGSTTTSFTRPTGSFVSDGFVAGMEVVPSGFADNTPVVINSVTALSMTLDKPRTAEADAAGRSLTVGIPPIRAWENVKVDTPVGRWYIDEDYIPGPVARITASFNGEYETVPMYVVRLSGLAGRSVGALYKVADAILRLFRPDLNFVLPDGTNLRVQSDPAPYRGQVLPGEAGHADIVITIPLRARTRYPIL